MKSYYLLLILSYMLMSCTNTSPTNHSEPELIKIDAPYSKPNIVMIVVDDLGWSDVGYNQTTNLFETPNIDALAKQSLSFDNAYSGAANCAPSRAVLMSGQYGPRHGVYTVSPSDRGEIKTRKLIPIKNKRGLNTDVITLAETLKTAGYSTATFGKWHLGAAPNKQGFDVNVAGSHQGMTFHYFSPYHLPYIEDGPQGEYLTNRLTSDSITWMKKQKDKPFFAYIPYYTVHTPYQADVDKIDKYRNKGINDEKQATYAAMVEHMDSSVGRILKMLEDENLDKNTLVIFTSDNGGYRMSSFPSPLRAGKGSYYEGGIRVPLLIRWKNQITPGVSHEPVINADFYPTLQALSQAEMPEQILDGINLSPLLLEGLKLDDRDLFWHFPIYLQAHHAPSDQSQDPVFRTRPGSAIRSGDWKLIQYFEDNNFELYNLKNDLAETTDVKTLHPVILKKLKHKLSTWQVKTGADIPIQTNPEYDADYNRKKIEQFLRMQP